MEQLEEISFIISKLILPFLTIILAIFAMWFTYKRKLLEPNKFENIRKDKNEHDVPQIVGNNNTIHLAPSEFQKRIAYDVDRFDEYHQHSINQSKISFWFSLVFASLGFMIITTSIFTFDNENGFIGLIAGTIIEAVSALFFYQSNKARQMMSEFFDRLRSDRKLEESLKLCDSIDNDLMRNSVKVKLSLYFSGLDDNHNLASEVIRLSHPEERIKKEVEIKNQDKIHNKTLEDE